MSFQTHMTSKEHKRFLKNVIYFCPYNKSQWGPKQHRTPIDFHFMEKDNNQRMSYRWESKG